MTKCPKCKGYGNKTHWDENVFCNTGFECDKCNGTVEVQTNEEWFCSLPIKKKAEVFRKFQDRGFMARSEVSVVSLPTTNEIEEWLKQPHTNKGVKE